MARFQPFEILRTLADHEVVYVLIGGLAAVFHGSTVRTGDADICPDPDLENLGRLADALEAMDAGLRVESEPDPIPFSYDAPFLAQMQVINLRTRFGALDITREPAGFRGYDELAEHAATTEARGIRIRIASLADIIRSKATANRPKDQQTLPALRALQDEIAKREQG